MEEKTLDSIIESVMAAIPTDFAAQEVIAGHVQSLDVSSRRRLADEAFERLLTDATPVMPLASPPPTGDSSLIEAFAITPELSHLDDRISALWGVFTPALSAYPILADFGLERVVTEISDLADVVYPPSGRARFRKIIRDFRASRAGKTSRDRHALALVGLALEISLAKRQLNPDLSSVLEGSIASLARWICGDQESAKPIVLVALSILCSWPRMSKRLATLIAFALSDVSDLLGEFSDLAEEDCTKIKQSIGANALPRVRFSDQRELLPRILASLLKKASGDGGVDDGDLLAAVANAADSLVGSDDDYKEGASPEFFSFAKSFSSKLSVHRAKGARGSACLPFELFTLIQSKCLIWFGGDEADLEGIEDFDVSMLLSVNQDGDTEDSDDFGWWKKDSEEFRVRLFELQMRGLVEEGFILQAEALACVYMVTELQVARRGGSAISGLVRMVRRALPLPWRWIPTLALRLADLVPISHLSAKLLLRSLGEGEDSVRVASVRKTAERNVVRMLGGELWMSLPLEMKAALIDREREWIDAQSGSPGADYGHLFTAYFKPYEARIKSGVIGALGCGARAREPSEGQEEVTKWIEEFFKGQIDPSRLTVDGALKILRAHARGKTTKRFGEELSKRFPGLTEGRISLLFELNRLRNEGTHLVFSAEDAEQARKKFLSPECVTSIRDLLYVNP